MLSILPAMELIIITPEETINNETEIISNLFDNGLQRLHIRKPRFNTEEYRNYIAAIDSKYHSHIVIHGSFELYEELKSVGIHLNSAARDDKAIWNSISHILPSDISTSFHSWLEIENNKYPYGYVFISPVFDSISKLDYKAGIDLKGAKEIKQKLARQNKYCPSIIGLGGVGAPQVKILQQYDFDGAAMLGTIWTASDPVGKFKEVLEAVKYL